MARKWWTLGAVSVATFMLLLDITVVNTALPAIEDDLTASFTDLQWVIDAYALTLAAFVLTAGSLADRLGRRRRVRRSASAIFTVASLAAGLAPDPTITQPRPRGAGNRRRDHVRRLAGADRAGVRGRPRARRWRWATYGATIGDRGRDRPARRRRADRWPRLGVGVLAQRADRDRGDRGDLSCKVREIARPERDPDRLGRGGDVQRRPFPARSGASARQRRGLGQRR